MSARPITPQGTATPAAIAAVRELLDAEPLVGAAEAAVTGVEVDDAAVVPAVADGDGDPVDVESAVEAAAAVEAIHPPCKSRSPPFRSSAHVPAVVVAVSAWPPRAQYASNTEMALSACADHIDELHENEMADVIS